MKQKILIIVGPTASGKSALGVELARKLGGEIVSADSRQVYRGLDIGTGKITKREMRGVRHHLLDVASLNRRFTAQNFVKQADAAIKDAQARGKLPIIVGGTGFYIDALIGRIQLPEVPPNKALRMRLEKKSANELFAMLKKKDRRRASKIDRHNKRRLIRALEIASSPFRTRRVLNGPQYDPLWVGINPPLQKLEKKIEKRLRARMKSGMVAEAKDLHARGLSYKRMRELGLEYRSLASFLQKKITREEMIAELTRDIRRYAKHQIAYWKRNHDILWFPTAKAALRSFK